MAIAGASLRVQIKKKLHGTSIILIVKGKSIWKNPSFTYLGQFVSHRSEAMCYFCYYECKLSLYRTIRIEGLHKKLFFFDLQKTEFLKFNF